MPAPVSVPAQASAQASGKDLPAPPELDLPFETMAIAKDRHVVAPLWTLRWVVASQRPIAFQRHASKGPLQRWVRMSVYEPECDPIPADLFNLLRFRSLKS